MGIAGEPDDRLNNFDLLRLAAALQVMLAHSGGWLGVRLPGPLAWLLLQFQGVAIFFVISGFLVTRSYLAADGAPHYFRNRALRIYPALWVHLTILLLLIAGAGALHLQDLATAAFWLWVAAAGATGSNHIADAASHFAFSFGAETFYKFFPSKVLWTIPVELGFYLLTPLVLASWIRRRGLLVYSLALWAVLAVIAAALTRSALSAYRTDPELQLWLLSPGPLFWIYLIGMILAVYWDRVSWLFVGRAPLWLGGYLALSAFDHWALGARGLNYRFPTLITFPRMLLLAGTVIALAYACKNAAKVLRGNDVSYGLYLYHVPVILTFHLLGYRGWAAYFAALALSLLLAAASWLAVERPALRLKQFGRQQGPVSSP